VIPNSHKVTDTLLSLTEGVGRDNCAIHHISYYKKEDQWLPFKDARVGIALLLPKIDPTSDKPMKAQVQADPLEVTSSHTISAYKNPKLISLVDSLNTAYATKIGALSKDSPKTVADHYRNARGHVTTLGKDVPFIDALGNRYDDIQAIPENVRGFLYSAFHYKEPKNKRKAEAAPDVEMVSSDDEEVQEPPPKKVKATRERAPPKGKTEPTKATGTHTPGAPTSRKGVSAPAGGSGAIRGAVVHIDAEGPEGRELAEKRASFKKEAAKMRDRIN